ncbi:S8 family serine peptidase [Streptomyces sp. NBC_01476]|uniref:S8 family serine peptidase n=1 Tax=Streptomyces sp. NBC_01476 TaxID=2903881 RepID=UPI002E34DACA|nr:S8 family serine peptidase [Streptomyces sp. NBC_01476]
MATSGDGRGNRCGALAAGLALLCAVGAAVPAVPAAADDGPTPLPSTDATAPALRLPVMPPFLDPTQSSCTKPSSTVMKAVPWAQQSLDLTRAHQLTSGAGVTVAVIDTGVSAAAPALRGRVTAPGAAGHDCVGHGTFVAGIIAAAPAAGSGFSGVAPAARILAVQGVGADGNPDEAKVAAGIRHATDAGAKVIDVSLAFATQSQALTSAVDYAAGHDVLIVAAGVPDNIRVDSDTDQGPPQIPFWPATQSGVLSVVDIDINGGRSTATVDPARADLAAPGQGITGIGPGGRGHFLGNGPSIAAAFTAGAAALVRAYDPALTAPEVATRLTTAAYPAPIPRLDPYAALSAVLPTDPGTGAVLPAQQTHVIKLVLNDEDPTPAHRAFLILAASLLAALTLTALALLNRRRRRNRTT